MTSPDLSTDTDLVRSFDGTLIAAQIMGGGDGRPLLVVNPIGVGIAPWRGALMDISRERRIVSWDHRGLHGSGAPASERIDAGAHAEDAIAVLDNFDISDVDVVAWSSGTRIGLELAHRYPERAKALALICGGYGYPLGRAVRRLELGVTLPTLAGLAKHFSSFMEPPFRSLTARPEFAGLVRQSGFVAPTTDIHALVEVLKGLAECDLKTLLSTYEAVAGDAVPDLLQEVQAPTLVIAAEHDRFTPMKLMEETARGIPGARMEVYTGATHYLPIEFPARLSHELRTFFAEATIA
jgi:pimeloyl-ACP methyl ester carboxylesterase